MVREGKKFGLKAPDMKLASEFLDVRGAMFRCRSSWYRENKTSI
jgi:hypothetical protein